MTIGILGGGLVGLVIGAHLKQPCEVLEADDVPGGHCRSLVADGYTFDLGGPHIMFSQNKETLDYMISLLGENVVTSRRNNQILYNGRYVKYPFENGLAALSPEDRYDCLYHFLYNDHKPGLTFKDWIYATFGKGIAEKYMLPYNEKIWNVPADQMSADWVEGRVPRPPAEDIIKSAVGIETEGYTHQLYFQYPRSGGIEALARAFAEKCRSIITRFPVRRVWREGAYWHVSDGKETRRYDRLISTIPIQDLISALPDVPGDVVRSVNALRFNSLSVVMLGVKSAQLLPYTALYIPDPGVPFHRVSFPHNFSDRMAPPGHMAVAAEITTNPGDGFHELDDETVFARVIDGLAKLKLIDPATVDFRAICRTKHAYVIRTFDYAQNLAAGIDYLNDLGIVSCGRNAEFAYINMDEAIRRGRAVATKINEEVGSGHWQK